MLSIVALLDMVKGRVSTLLGMNWFWQVNIIRSIMLGWLLPLVNQALMKRRLHILKARLMVLIVPSIEKISLLRKGMTVAAL